MILKRLIVRVVFLVVLLWGVSCAKAPETAVVYPEIPVPGGGLAAVPVSPRNALISWNEASDSQTPAANLLYRVFVSPDPQSIDSVEELTLADTPWARTAWISYPGSFLLSDLPENSRSFVAVLVRDADGMGALYPPVSVDTPRSNPPYLTLAGSLLAVEGITETSALLRWNAAADDLDPAENLSYRVVRSSWKEGIDTLPEVLSDWITVIADWQPGITEQTVYPEVGWTTQYFAVVVRDSGGNNYMYTPVRVDFAPVSQSPVVPNPPGFTVTFVSGSHFTLQWNPATDTGTIPSELRYKVVRSEDWSLIDTVAEVVDITTSPMLCQDFEYELTTPEAMVMIMPGTDYYVSVLVIDTEGNYALYPLYSFNAPSANLAGLILQDYSTATPRPFNETFVPTVTSYTVAIPSGSPVVNLVVQPEDPGAAITVNSITVFAGSPYMIDLSVNPTLWISVTAPGGFPMMNYSVTASFY